MNLEFVQEFLLWCLAVNYGVLLVWFAVLVFARDWVMGLHARCFKLTPETFDLVHYAAMAVYKIGVLLFNLAPLAALWIMGGGR